MMNQKIREILYQASIQQKTTRPGDLEDSSFDILFQIAESEPKPDRKTSQGFRRPDPSEIITYDQATGKPLSRFSDDVWRQHYNGGDIIIDFGNPSKYPCIDFTSPSHTHLQSFRKILTYYQVAGKNPYARVKSFNTTKSRFNSVTHLAQLFYENGYLIDIGGSYKTINNISAEDLKQQINTLLDTPNPPSNIFRLINGIIIWAKLSRLNILPLELSATFTEKQVFTKDLQRALKKHETQHSGRWESIEYDDLAQLMQTATLYIDNFAEDLIYLMDKFEDGRSAQVAAGHRKPKAELWTTHGATRHLGKELLSYSFARDPRTNLPWMQLDVASFSREDWGGTTNMVRKNPIIFEWLVLTQSAIFLLLAWTAMRVSEFVNLQVADLSIDGQPYDYKMNAIIEVKSGQSFDLKRTVTKTEDCLGGKGKKVPVPRLGALAFAVLIEFYRRSRDASKNKYLLPAGMLQGHGGPGGVVRTDKKQGPLSTAQVRRSLYRFCDYVGVEQYHPHQLRKTLATMMITRNPGSLELVKDLLCHRDINMTIKYLMSIPAIAEDVKDYMAVANRVKLIEWLSDAIDGKVAGQAGDKTLDAIAGNRDFFRGELLPITLQNLIESVCPDHIIIRTPAAWCLRFPSMVPLSAPCLPEINSEGTSISEIYPNPSECRPWLCRYSGHTTSDITRAKKSLQWARKKAQDSLINPERRAQYAEQASYWAHVVEQLSIGRPDITAMGIADMISGEAAGWN